MMARGMTLEVKAEVNNIAPLRDVYIVGVPPGHSKGPDGMIRPWSESEALWKAKGLTPPAIVYDEPRLVSDNNTETFDADYIEADEVQRPQLDDLEPLLPAKPEVKRDAQYP